MKRQNYLKLLFLGVALGLPLSVGSQQAVIPFNQTATTAKPNVLVFFDNSPSMTTVDNPTTDPRGRNQITMDVIAGVHDRITYSVSGVAKDVFQPHYDFTTTGGNWVFTQVAEDAALPKVILLSYNFAGYYVPDPAGSYILFYHPNDSTRLAALTAAGAIQNLGAFMRSLQPASAAISDGDRWVAYYLIRDSTTATVRFSSSDNSNNRIIWHADDAPAGTYLTFNQAVKKYYNYSATGNETGTDNRIIVPLKRIAANSSASWTSPSDGLLKTGLCYKSGPTWYMCYKPVPYNDANATRFLVYDELSTTQKSAQQIDLYKIDLTSWRTARVAAGDTLNGNASRYCQAETKEVWGDAPYATWKFDTNLPYNRPLYDDPSTTARPLYGATIGGATTKCASSSPGAFNVGITPPTDTALATLITNQLVQSTAVDASMGATIDEFIIPTTTSTRIDTYLKAKLPLNHTYWCSWFAKYTPDYVCPAVPTWPGSITFNDPWYGGFFDHLYYDDAYRSSPGIMQQFPNVNYGVMNIAKGKCTDFPSSGYTETSCSTSNWRGCCYVANLLYSPSSWGEFPAYSADHPTTLLNDNIRNYLISVRTTWEQSNNTPISSLFESMWRFFFNINMTTKGDTSASPDLVHTANTDVGDVLDPRTTSTGADINSMFFDLGFPTATGFSNKHIIQCDPFYIMGCRRNYVIFLTDGENYHGANDAATGTLPNLTATLKQGKDGIIQKTTINPSTWGNSNVAAKYKWIRALVDPAYTPKATNSTNYPATSTTKCSVTYNGKTYTRGTTPEKWGIKMFFVGFTKAAAWGTEFMAWASTYKVNQPAEDEIDYMLPAGDEAGMRESFTTVMNAIMAGNYTRSAPDVSELDNAIITSYFDVGGTYPLWRGHLLKYDLDNLAGGTEWDVATAMSNTSIQSPRTLFTALTDSGGDLYRFDFVSSGAGSNTDIIAAFDPFYEPAYAWGTTLSVRKTKADALIKFIRSDSDATFVTGKAHKVKLGPIVHSKPVIVSRPNSLTYSGFPGYGTFMHAKMHRPSTVYVGTGYGVLEAISLAGSTTYSSIKSGEEVFGFVPTGVLRTLNYNRLGMQVYGDDGTPVIKDAIFYDPDTNAQTWHTALVSGLAGGGTSYFALDITDVTDDPKTQVGLLWNFRDPNLGFTWSVPVIAPIAALTDDDPPTPYLKWAAFFGGGMQKNAADPTLGPDLANYFYIVDLQTGASLAKIELPDIDAITQFTPLQYDDDLPSFNQVPATPFLVDKDMDRDYDYAYIGDQEGRLWKIMFGTPYDPDGSNPDWKACLLYDTADADFNGVLEGAEIKTKANRTPIFYTPDVTRTPDDQLVVYFATGNAEFTKEGEPSLTYHAYAIVDPETDDCSYAQQLPATIGGETTAWPIAFEAKEKPITPMYIIGGKLTFKTFLATPTVPCTQGTARLWSLDYLTGQAVVPGQKYTEAAPGGNLYGTGGFGFDLKEIVDVDPLGGPTVTQMPVLAADPLSWGEGMTF